MSPRQRSDKSARLRSKPPTVSVPARKVLGFLDQIDATGIGGWVVDFANPAPGLRIRVLVDGNIADVITCDVHRDDARLLKLPTRRIGFYFDIPERFRDGLRHVMTFSNLDGTGIQMASGAGEEMAELNFCLPRSVRVEGVADGMVDGLIRGWAVNIDDHAKTKVGGVRILITAAGEPVGELLADQYRPDVAAAIGCDASCGFAFAPPAALRHRKRTELRFLAMPGRQELRGSPMELAFTDDGERARLTNLIARADELFAFAYRLHRELKAAMPAERYLLSDYGRWAADSLPLALPRAIANYGALPPDAPLVSIVCPVYRPEITDFLRAIDSVRAQTYQNWELVLVDDASRDAALAQMMLALGRIDGRIKLIALRKNGGIANATNVAIKAASGKFIVFLDHDDLLEAGALEILLRAQAATAARLLYSDEDKVDGTGALSEPHFKPDFNYRFLLEVNYICHLVMVEAALLKAVGVLDSQLDGAQDHDLLLRVSEVLEPRQIHHVPEILYHWRKAANSTATAGSGAKPMAAKAGVAAVAAHLRRRKINAEVSARAGLTCYQLDWKPSATTAQAARVSILIPFRDHIAMTAECVAAIRSSTQDVEYEIVLLDNWSTSPETEAFTTAQANTPHTKVIRILEPFNFSRLNNIGVQATNAPFVLFLNNDVIVREPLWLRRMLNECLINEGVGAVGAKLIYPNGTVQHAGVVLGVGGVADHAFRGIAADAPGYVLRAIATQQISAVTAACMLVRRSAFDSVGGFDEAELSVAFNDVDLCVRLSGAGWDIIYAPDAVAEHRESISRGDDFDERKIARFMLENEVMRQRHGKTLLRDPFYNRNFSRESGVYGELRLLAPADI